MVPANSTSRRSVRLARACMRARVTANTAVANPCAGEIMTSLAAHHDEDEGKVKKLKRAAEDAALAVRALGGVKAAQLGIKRLMEAGVQPQLIACRARGLAMEIEAIVGRKPLVVA